MTSFNIINITPAGALCNAWDAADKYRSDIRTAQESTGSETTDDAGPLLAAIRDRLWNLIRPYGATSGKAA